MRQNNIHRRLLRIRTKCRHTLLFGLCKVDCNRKNVNVFIITVVEEPKLTLDCCLW